MLTTEGKNHIRRYLAGYVPAMVQSMSLGIGATTETTADTALQLEVVRTPIALTSYDFATNKLIYKASVPDDYVGKIYEVGLYTLDQDPMNPEFASRLITTFDSATEDWLTSGGAFAPFVTTNTRIGADSLSIAPAASGSQSYYLSDIQLDLSGYSGTDTFRFAFYSANANTSSMNVRFLTDASNYYQFNLGAQTSGYKFVELNKNAAVTTGTPSWSNITQLQVTVNAGAGGAAGIEFDAIRVEDKDTANNLDYILVARKVLASPVTKVEGRAQDIEFALDVTL